MFVDVLLVLEGLLIASGLLSLQLPSSDRQFALSLVRAMVGLSLLIVLYVLDASQPTPESSWAVLLSEAIVAVLWGFMALRLQRAMLSTESESPGLCITELVACLTVGFAAFFLPGIESSSLATDSWVIRHKSFAYYSAFMMLFSMLLTTWRLEGFWRNLEAPRRWQYKFFVVGILLVCCSFVWSASYRLTYMLFHQRHLPLLAILLSGGLSMIVYAIARHRLLNKKIFVSRKIVQASVAPVALATYLVGLGTLALAAQSLGWSIHYFFFWVLVAVGFVGTGLYLFSGRLRKRVHHFISSHFYVNKYEYRDEWLALSHLLRGAITEAEIVSAVAQILADSLYVNRLVIWISNHTGGLTMLHPREPSSLELSIRSIPAGSPLLERMKPGEVLYLGEPAHSMQHELMKDMHGEVLHQCGVVLLSPILAGEQLLGVIGVGEELTGEPYGTDDFDLISAIGTQAASALMAARMSDELGRLNQLEAFSTLSAFVLHDVKNAATMLSLVRDNFEEHIHDPEFQADMLEAIDNALRRMGKVQDHLRTLKGDITPRLERIDLCLFLRDFVREVLKKSTGMTLTLDCPNPIFVETDQGFLVTILENLIMNSFQAGGPGTKITLKAVQDPVGSFVIELLDEGPGIPADLLPDRLFAPFQTTRTGGTGIGLWQARTLVTRLGGKIQAENAEVGARFIIQFHQD